MQFNISNSSRVKIQKLRDWARKPLYSDKSLIHKAENFLCANNHPPVERGEFVCFVGGAIPTGMLAIASETAKFEQIKTFLQNHAVETLNYIASNAPGVVEKIAEFGSHFSV